MMHKYSTATKVGPPRGEDFFLEKKKRLCTAVSG